MWKSSIGKVLFPHFFVEREVEHFIELLPIHECVGVQERVAADVSGESAKRTLGWISIRGRETCFSGDVSIQNFIPPYGIDHIHQTYSLAIFIDMKVLQTRNGVCIKK
jgi:hypothetical protein